MYTIILNDVEKRHAKKAVKEKSLWCVYVNRFSAAHSPATTSQQYYI